MEEEFHFVAERLGWEGGLVGGAGFLEGEKDEAAPPERAAGAAQETETEGAVGIVEGDPAQGGLPTIYGHFRKYRNKCGKFFSGRGGDAPGGGRGRFLRAGGWPKSVHSRGVRW